LKLKLAEKNEGKTMRVLSKGKVAFLGILGLMSSVMFGAAAWAQEASDEVFGKPYPDQIALQKGVTSIARDIKAFDDALLIISFLIAMMVLALLAYASYRFSAKRNPVPATFSHNTLIEVIWTVLPIVILVGITIPSIRLLRAQDLIPVGDLTIKATGNQWNWTYSYPDHGDLEFDAFMVAEEDLVAGQPRLLATDEPVVVPVNKTVRVIVTASDVIHAWAIPAFGIKIDAVPGRINETWFKAEREGTYYGQCSELCGVDHAFMPIEVKVVSEAEFAAWTAKMAGLETDEKTQLAAVETK
jgi:cytochrome c oxidase subunit II